MKLPTKPSWIHNLLAGAVLLVAVLSSGCYTTFKSTRGVTAGESYRSPDQPAYVEDEAYIEDTVTAAEGWREETTQPDYGYQEPSRTVVYQEDGGGDIVINNYYFMKRSYPPAFAWVYDPFYDPFYDINVVVYTPLPVVVVDPWYDWYAPIWVAYPSPYYPGCFYPPLGVVYPVYPRFGFYFAWYDDVYYPAYRPHHGGHGRTGHEFGRRTWNRRGGDRVRDDSGIRRRQGGRETTVPGHRTVVRQPGEPPRQGTIIPASTRPPARRRISTDPAPAVHHPPKPIRTAGRSRKAVDTPRPVPRPRVSTRVRVAENTPPRPSVHPRPVEKKKSDNRLKRVVSSTLSVPVHRPGTVARGKRTASHRSEPKVQSRAVHRPKKHGPSLLKKVFKT
ncbi:MAG: hypothetical protein D6715_11970, partial [Calditrichaeota bacterium]